MTPVTDDAPFTPAPTDRTRPELRGQLTKSDLKDGQKVDENKSKGQVEKKGRITKKDTELAEEPLTRNEGKLVAACDTKPGSDKWAAENLPPSVKYYADPEDCMRNSGAEAVEAAGDVNTLLLDKTGTITLSNRQASEFIPMPGVEPQALAEAAREAGLEF